MRYKIIIEERMITQTSTESRREKKRCRHRCLPVKVLGRS